MAAIGQLRTVPNPPTPPSSSGLRTPLFLLGVGLALFAFIAMIAFGIVFARSASTGRSISVVVAAQDIQAREPILPDMVMVSSLPETAVPPHSFTRATDLAGYAAVVPIYKGQVLSANIVSSNPDDLTGQTAEFLPIPTGDVAVTIPTSELQGVAGYPAPGDYMKITATINTVVFNPHDPFPRSVSAQVFSDMYILRVGPPLVGKQGQAQGVVGSVTILMTPCDSIFLAWLIQNASLRYELVSYKDYATSNVASDPECPHALAFGVVGPAEVDARWKFTKG
jgi:Flp pilus assembly protein CpaB